MEGAEKKKKEHIRTSLQSFFLPPKQNDSGSDRRYGKKKRFFFLCHRQPLPFIIVIVHYRRRAVPAIPINFKRGPSRIIDISIGLNFSFFSQCIYSDHTSSLNYCSASSCYLSGPIHEIYLFHFRSVFPKMVSNDYHSSAAYHYDTYSDCRCQPTAAAGPFDCVFSESKTLF